uniref:Uncharacterized protein n=1 Tax=Anopheles maculatus TaxID=74869 RepID=A0A182SB05_9DIPT
MGKGVQPRHTRKEDKKPKPDDAISPVEPRATDFHGNKGQLPDGERGRLATHSRTSHRAIHEYLESHNTRNMLEQLQGKLNTLLEQRSEQQEQASQRIPTAGHPFVKEPGPSATELEKNIAILKADLNGYLCTMNQKNEN